MPTEYEEVGPASPTDYEEVGPAQPPPMQGPQRGPVAQQAQKNLADPMGAQQIGKTSQSILGTAKRNLQEPFSKQAGFPSLSDAVDMADPELLKAATPLRDSDVPAPVIKGAAKSIAGAADFMQTPLGVTTLPVAGATGAVGIAARAGFGILGAKTALQGGQQAAEGFGAQNPEQIGEGLGNLALGGGMMFAPVKDVKAGLKGIRQMVAGPTEAAGRTAPPVEPPAPEAQRPAAPPPSEPIMPVEPPAAPPAAPVPPEVPPQPVAPAPVEAPPPRPARAKKGIVARAEPVEAAPPAVTAEERANATRGSYTEPDEGLPPVLNPGETGTVQEPAQLESLINEMLASGYTREQVPWALKMSEAEIAQQIAEERRSAMATAPATPQPAPPAPTGIRGKGIVRKPPESVIPPEVEESIAGASTSIHPNRVEVSSLKVAAKDRGMVDLQDVPAPLEKKIAARRNLEQLADKMFRTEGVGVGKFRFVDEQGNESFVGEGSMMPKGLQGHSNAEFQSIIKKGLAGEKLTADQQTFFNKLQRYALKKDGPINEGDLQNFLDQEGLTLPTRGEVDTLAEREAIQGEAGGEPAQVSGRAAEIAHEEAVTAHATPGAEYEVRSPDGTPIVRLRSQANRLGAGMPRGYGTFEVVKWLHEGGENAAPGDYSSPAYFEKWWRSRADQRTVNRNGKAIREGNPNGYIQTTSADMKFLHPVERGVEELSPAASEAQRGIEERDAAHAAARQRPGIVGSKPVQGDLGLSRDRGIRGSQMEIGDKPRSRMAFPSEAEQFARGSQKIEEALGEGPEFGSRIAHQTGPAAPQPATPPRQQIALQKDIFREEGAKYALTRKHLDRQLNETRNDFDKGNAATRQARYLDFTDKMEGGQAQSSPQLQKAADSLRKILDEGRAKVQATGTGALDNFITDYYPHLWQDPEAASKFVASWIAKRPLEGSKAFLKQRTIPTIREGVNAGLRPIFDNPVDDVLAKRAEMDRFVLGQNAIQRGVAEGTVAPVPDGGKIPRGWKQLPTVKGGTYMAIEPVAEVFSKFLSPGLQNNKLYRGYMGVARAMTQAQLSLSAFHGVTSAMNSMMSSVELGGRQALTMPGQRVEGIGKVLRGITPIEPIIQTLRGDKMMKAILDDPLMQEELTKRLTAGGGRVNMEHWYFGNEAGNFMRAMRRGEYGKAILKSPFAAIEATARPVMQYLVPRLKLAAFQDMAQAEIARLGPDASPQMRAHALGRAWDSVDNRFGQLVYDNLFWNKTAKDLGIASMRSLGWNLGTVRELGGAAKDISTIGRRIRGEGIPGEAPVTPRMGYAVALPFVAGLYGAVYHYLSGNGVPQSLDDYYHPKGADGRRYDLPTYMREVYGDAYRLGAGGGRFRPLDIAKAKANPALMQIIDQLKGKDWQDRDIRDERAPMMTQLKQSLQYWWRSMEPISIQKMKGLKGEEAAQSAFGITTTPKYVQRPGVPSNYKYQPSRVGTAR